MARLTWKTRRLKLADLKEWDKNPRMMTEEEFNDMAKSLEKFSLADPLVVNTDLTIIGGHHRRRFLISKGQKTADCRIPSRKLSEKAAEELALRLNRNIGQWDKDKLKAFDAGKLEEYGFKRWEFETESGKESQKQEIEEKETDKEEPEEWVTFREVFGISKIPRSVADLIKEATDRFIDAGHLGGRNRWQLIEFLVADYLAGECVLTRDLT